MIAACGDGNCRIQTSHRSAVTVAPPRDRPPSTRVHQTPAGRRSDAVCGNLPGGATRLSPRLFFRPMNIEITTKKSEGVERLLEVSVPADEVRTAEDQAARRYASRVRLPGFRPGK